MWSRPCWQDLSFGCYSFLTPMDASCALGFPGFAQLPNRWTKNIPYFWKSTMMASNPNEGGAFTPFLNYLRCFQMEYLWLAEWQAGGNSKPGYNSFWDLKGKAVPVSSSRWQCKMLLRCSEEKKQQHSRKYSSSLLEWSYTYSVLQIVFGCSL